MRLYKGYKIEKVTPKDWIIYNADGTLSKLNGRRCYANSTIYSLNALTLKEAKARIDEATK